MRISYFFILGAVCSAVGCLARFVAHFSPSVGRWIGDWSAHVAGRWFVAGTGWGGDDVVLESLRGNPLLREHVRRVALSHASQGKKASRVVFLNSVASAGEGGS